MPRPPLNKIARHSIFGSSILSLLALCLTLSTPALAPAQVAPVSTPPDPAAPAAAGNDLVTLDFPADGIELSVLADIVTKQLHIPIIYDEQIRGKKVIIRVPLKVPESALMGILQSALRLKQMALIDAEQRGWKQIVPALNLAAVAKPAQAGATGEGPIAEVFVLTHADPGHIAEIIRPFLTQPGGSLQPDPSRKTLIVSDYASVVRRVEDLIKTLDADTLAVQVSFVPLKQAEAAQIVPALTQLIANREFTLGGGSTTPGISITADERTNQIVIVADEARTKDVLELIAGMDKAPDLTTKVYRLKTVSPDRLDRLVRGLLGPTLIKRSYQSVVDRESASLAVSATPEVHARIDELVKNLDVPVPDDQSPIRFYKLKNTKAAEVLATISGLLGQDQQQSGGEGSTSATGANGGAVNPANGESTSAQSSALSPRPSTPAGLNNASPALTNAVSSAQSTNNPGGPGAVYAPGGSHSSGADSSESTGNSQSPQLLSVKGANATVAADVNSNSIIVIAPPLIQKTYADLIKRLDERRPQVQIQCTIVSLDTADGFTFGVDIGKLGGFGTSQLLTLSSFGISMANPTTGALTPVNRPGGTFGLLSPRIANVVINTLETNSHAKFLSAPELLVNDNGKGKLESVQDEPYAVLLDASTTNTVTSFGGQAEAGTSISVEPHISEADYLQLAYDIELSSFTGAASNGLPPPSQKNTVDSSVTIPDGYTIVVGGLTTKTFNKNKSVIPWLGDIPVLEYLFGTHSKNSDNNTLFVFIKPVILRDDKFEDLKYISTTQTKAAGLAGDYPLSDPIPMR